MKFKISSQLWSALGWLPIGERRESPFFLFFYLDHLHYYPNCLILNLWKQRVEVVRGEKHNRSSLVGTWWVSNYKHSGFGRCLKLAHPLIECFGGVLGRSPRKKTPSWKFIQRKFTDELSRNALEGSKGCNVRQTERLSYDAVATKIWVDLASRLDSCIPTFFRWTSSSKWSVPTEEEWLWVR